MLCSYFHCPPEVETAFPHRKSVVCSLQSVVCGSLLQLFPADGLLASSLVDAKQLVPLLATHLSMRNTKGTPSPHLSPPFSSRRLWSASPFGQRPWAQPAEVCTGSTKADWLPPSPPSGHLHATTSLVASALLSSTQALRWLLIRRDCSISLPPAAETAVPFLLLLSPPVSRMNQLESVSGPI